MADISALVKSTVTAMQNSTDSKVETANEAVKQEVINEVRETVVKEVVVQETGGVDISGLATKEEVSEKLDADKVWNKNADYFQTKYNGNNGSYAMLWNESDGGGSQYRNAPADIISYVGTNDGNADGICVQIYSKYKDGTTGTKNSGTRLNVNPNKIYYTKGTNTDTNGGSEDNELAVKADIPDVSTKLEKSDVFKNDVLYVKQTDADGSYNLQFHEKNSGGGNQFYNANDDSIHYLGVNKSVGKDAVNIQLYSKYKSAVEGENAHAANFGTRININPWGAYYTKGTNTSYNGGTNDNEIAVKGDVKALLSTINALQEKIEDLYSLLENAVDKDGNPVYVPENNP